MRKSLAVLALIVSSVSGCGPMMAPVEADRQALDLSYCTSTPFNRSACSSEIEWSAGAPDSSKVCTGGFEYRAQCCDYGLQTLASCKHTHELTDYTESFVQKAALVTCPPYSGTIVCPKSWVYPACDKTVGAVDAIFQKVKAARDACNVSAVPRGGVVDPSSVPTIITVWASAAANGADRTCTVTVRGAPLGHNCTPNQCDDAADVKVCGWKQDSRLITGCSAAYPPDGVTRNNDGTLVTWIDSSACSNGAKLYGGAGWTLQQFKDSIDSRQRSSWRCLTGEDAALLGASPTSASVTAKWDAMRTAAADASPLSGVLPSLARQIVQHRQLLFELHGELLDATRRAEGEALYMSNPGVTPDPTVCGSSWTPPTATCAQADPVALGALIGKLAMCRRLGSAHVSQALAALETKQCSDAGSLAIQLPAAAACSARSALLTEYASIVTEELRKGFKLLPEQDPGARRAILQDRLAQIQGHYLALKQAESGPDLWRDVTTVTEALERGAYSNSVALVDPCLPAASMASNAQHLASGYAVDREILNAVLQPSATGQPPLTTAPALFLLADGFRATSERLNDVDFLHDVGCRFRECTGGYATNVSQMHALLGAMADPVLLGSTYNNRSGAVPADWRGVFTNLVQQYDRVVASAVKDAVNKQAETFQASFITSATEAQLPVFKFAEIVAPSRVKADNFARTGRFRSEDSKPIYMGLLRSAMPLVQRDVNAARQSLLDAISGPNGYDTLRTTLLAQQMQYMAGQNAEANAASLLKQRGLEVLALAQDLKGLRVSATVDLERFGDLGKALEDAFARLEATSGNRYVTKTQVGPGQRPFAVSAQHPNIPPAGAALSDISKIAVAGPFRASPGHLLLVDASGSWSPTCAVQLAKTAHGIRLENAIGAVTGPQGFGIQRTGGVYETSYYTTENFESYSNTESSCMSESGSVSIDGTYHGSGSKLVLSGTAEKCSETSSGHRSAVGWSTGDDYRTTAAFNAGLRLPNTPFPEYPAGALLAVKVQAGRTSPTAIVDVAVIQAPSTTVLVSGIFGLGTGVSHDQDIYLVANEVRSPDCVYPYPLPPTLTIDIKHVQPAAAFGRHVLKAMAKTYAWLEDTIRRTILPQGRLLARQSTDLQEKATYFLYDECSQDETGRRIPCDLAVYDTDLMQAYRTWVGHALAQAERHVEIVKVERQLAVAVMQWEGLAAELTGLRRQNEIAWLFPAWTVRNLDAFHMRSSAQSLARVVDQYVHPFLTAKYPEARTGTAGIIGIAKDTGLLASLDGLTSQLDWTSEFSVPAKHAVNAADRALFWLTQVYDSPQTPASEKTSWQVAIGFKKPESAVDPNLNHLTILDPDGNPTTTYTAYASTHFPPRYREASPERAQRLWDAILANTTATFEILPEDLYQYRRKLSTAGAPLPLYDAQLSCQYTIPVVRAMGLYIVSDGDTEELKLNASARQVDLWAAPELAFLDTSHPEIFFMANPAWTNMTVPVTYGLSEQAVSTFLNGASAPYNAKAPLSYAAGEGLPAVGSYAIESGFRTWLDPVNAAGRRRAAGLVVVLDVEVRDRGPGSEPAWIQNCAP